MRKIRFGTNFAVFLGFFGIATLEALQTANWIKAGFWLAIAFLFLYMDSARESRSDL
jgi:hypothetical protein